VRLMRELKPASYVKGGDYRIDDLPEAEVAAELGAEVRILPFELEYSTTALIERIRSVDRTTGAHLDTQG
jgi:bifunctional ADP-heptose synthase (sugar kinase/adenylyltransferase)